MRVSTVWPGFRSYPPIGERVGAQWLELAIAFRPHEEGGGDGPVERPTNAPADVGQGILALVRRASDAFDDHPLVGADGIRRARVLKRDRCRIQGRDRRRRGRRPVTTKSAPPFTTVTWAPMLARRSAAIPSAMAPASGTPASAAIVRVTPATPESLSAAFAPSGSNSLSRPPASPAGWRRRRRRASKAAPGRGRNTVLIHCHVDGVQHHPLIERGPHLLLRRRRAPDEPPRPPLLRRRSFNAEQRRRDDQQRRQPQPEPPPSIEKGIACHGPVHREPPLALEPDLCSAAMRRTSRCPRPRCCQSRGDRPPRA